MAKLNLSTLSSGWLLLSSVALASCSTTRNNEVCPVIDVDVDFESTSENASEFFDRYSYVSLQSNDSVPLGAIQLIDLDEDRIVIGSGSAIHIYDRDGMEQAVFDHRGHGPGEYISIQDLAIGNEGIYVLSWSMQKVLLYGFDGKHIDTFELPYRYAALQYHDGNLWLASEACNDSGYEFFLYDCEKREIIGNVIPFEKNQSTFSAIGMFNPFLYNSDKELMVARQYDYTIYEIDSKDSAREAWEYEFNTEKQFSDFGNDLSYPELYTAASNQPVIMWPGMLWMTKEHVYQTLSVFHIISRFTNIYKFSPSKPNDKGILLHIGLKEYEAFPFLYSSPLTIKEGCYISAMPTAIVKEIADKKISTSK